MTMKDFWNKLAKWVEVNKDAPIIIHSFILDDGTTLSPEIAMCLWKEHSMHNHLVAEYDKMCDYNRLLRKENYELMEQLDNIGAFNDCDEEDDINNNGGNGCGYLS